MNVIETLGRFLDPIIAIRKDDAYWTPNGNHRLQALKKLGAKTVIALLGPDPDVAFKILALNTEKAHNLKEKSLETIRMERALADSERAASKSVISPSSSISRRSSRSARHTSSGRGSAAAHTILSFGASRTFSTSASRRLSWNANGARRRCSPSTTRWAGLSRSSREERTHQPVSAPVRRRKDQPDPILHLDGIRLRRRARPDEGKAAAKFNVDKIRQEDVVRAGGAAEEE